MYAVIETGGKQYRVEVGTELEVELLDVEPGQSVTLERVLLVADGDETSVGRPLVANAAVEAEVLRRERGDKVIVFKYRPKARRRVKKGHRQDHTILRVSDITFDGRSAAESTRKAQQDAKSERQRLEEAAARQAAADAELAARLAKQADAKATKASKAGAATTDKTTTDTTTADTTTTDTGADAAAEAAPKARARAAAAALDAGEPSEALDAASVEPTTGDATGTDADDETIAEAPKRSRTKKDE